MSDLDQTMNETDTKADTQERRSLFAFDDPSAVKQDISWVIDSIGDDAPIIVESRPEQEGNVEQEEESDSDIHEDTDDELSEEDEENKRKKKKKNRVTAEKRIADLTRKAKEFQSIAYESMTQKAELERQLAKTQKESAKNYEHYLVAEKNKIKDVAVKAYEEGDARTHADALELLNQYNDEISQLKNSYRYNEASRQPEQIPHYLTEDFDQPDYELDQSQHDSAMKWVKKNTWADSSSKNYNQGLVDKADNYSVKLAEAYSLEGRAEDIGGDDFWEEISGFMNDNYNVRKNSNKITMKAPSGSSVSTPTRRASSETNPRYRKEISLSKEQREMAHSLRGIIKDDRGHRIMDKKGAEEAYARQILRG